MEATENGFIVIDDVRLEYCRLGENRSGAPTLVLLHEGLGSVAMWKNFPMQLAKITGLEVFVYSRQSYGKSSALADSRKADYMHYEATDVLVKVLDVAKIEKPLIVGHSDGASIAIIYAGAKKLPEPVTLILMAPHVFNEDISVKSIRAASQAYAKGNLRERLGIYHDDVDNSFWRWNDIWLDDDFRNWNIEEYLGNISIPVLQIQGENDEYGTHAQLVSIKTQCTGPVEELILDDCGHSPFRDQEAATLAGIHSFVERYKICWKNFERHHEANNNT